MCNERLSDNRIISFFGLPNMRFCDDTAYLLCLAHDSVWKLRICVVRQPILFGNCVSALSGMRFCMETAYPRYPACDSIRKLRFHVVRLAILSGNCVSALSGLRFYQDPGFPFLLSDDARF